MKGFAHIALIMGIFLIISVIVVPIAYVSEGHSAYAGVFVNGALDAGGALSWFALWRLWRKS